MLAVLKDEKVFVAPSVIIEQQQLLMI